MKRALGLTVLSLSLMTVGAGAQNAQPPAKKPPADAAARAETVTVDIINSIPAEDRKNLSPYRTVVENRTKQQLLHVLPAIAKPPASTPGLVKITAWVHTDGRVTGMTFEQRSGKTELDRAALAAITGSSPYDAFPYGIAVDQVKVRFTFSYNNGVAGPSNGSDATTEPEKKSGQNGSKPAPPPILSDKHPQ